MTKNNQHSTEPTAVCSRCRRERRIRFLIERKNYSGRLVRRCRKRSVCHSIAKRINPDYRRSVQAHGKRASGS